MSPQTPDLKTPVYCEIQRDLPGSDRLNQHCVTSFGRGLNVTDVHSYVEVTTALNCQAPSTNNQGNSN